MYNSKEYIFWPLEPKFPPETEIITYLDHLDQNPQKQLQNTYLHPSDQSPQLKELHKCITGTKIPT